MRFCFFQYIEGCSTPSIMVSFNFSQNLQEQSAMDEFDPVSNLERLKISTLKKAIALKDSTGRVTIGPASEQNARSVDTNGCSNGEFATSTPISEALSPDPKKNLNPKRLSFDSTLEKSSVESTSKARKIDPVPHTLLLKVYEQQRRESVKEAMQRRLEKFREMDRKSKEELETLKNEMKMEALSKAAIEHERLQKELEQEEKNSAIRMEQLMIRNENHAKRLNEVSAKARELEKKELEDQEIKREKWKERKNFLDKIFANQLQFRQKYQEFCEFIRNCGTSKELMAVISSDIDKARFVTDSMDDFVEKCRDGVVEAGDVESASSFVAQINEIYNNIKAQVDKFKAEKLACERTSQAVNEAEAFHAAGAPKSTTSSEFSSNLGTGEFADPRCLKTYNQLKKFLKSVEESFEPFYADSSLKQFRFLCQKAVITPVNAISPESRAHLVDKYDKLSNLLAGRTVTVNNKVFSATSHPLGIQFCKYTLAKKFVEQGERNVSSHPEAAFAIATVIVALWQLYPDFGQLLVAFFHRVNPYLIPACWPQVEGQSNQDYYKLLGYEYSEDNEVEKQDKYLKRLSGVVRLYAAITITKTKTAPDAYPHGLSNAWRWFAAILNLEPVPDVTATFLLDFIEVAGSDMTKYYQKQFQKLLIFICKEYFSLIEKVSPEGGGAPLNRLKELLSQILKKGHVPPPKGLLPQSFWI